MGILAEEHKKSGEKSKEVDRLAGVTFWTPPPGKANVTRRSTTLPYLRLNFLLWNGWYRDYAIGDIGGHCQATYGRLSSLRV